MWRQLHERYEHAESVPLKSGWEPGLGEAEQGTALAHSKLHPEATVLCGESCFCLLYR